jgi:hypothetical protein
MSDNHETMSDYEVALMDALKTVFEIIVAKKVTTPQAIAGLLGGQREIYEQTGVMPGAVFVMKSLIDFVADPARVEARKLHGETPQGIGITIKIGGSTDAWFAFSIRLSRAKPTIPAQLGARERQRSNRGLAGKA